MGKRAYPAAIRGRRAESGGFAQRLEVRDSNYANAVTTVHKDSLLMLPKKLAKEVRPKASHCIEASYSKGVNIRDSKPRRQVVAQGSRLRKLTPRECWRLMGFSDTDFDKARAALNRNLYNGSDRSSSQLYRQAGNSIVVDVLLAILEQLYAVMPHLFEDMKVGSFFSGIGAFEKALERLEEKPPG